MAEKATPSAAKVATADTAAPEGKQQKQDFVKPEKPDEAAFKEGLAKFDKEHEAAREKLVSSTISSPRCQLHCISNWKLSITLSHLDT